jgi:hypothetical protein
MRQTNQIARIRNTPHRPGPQPLQRPNVRASEHDIASQTGGSKTEGTPYHRHVVHSVEGDRRQGGLHSGEKTQSRVPQLQAGKPLHGPMNGGDTNGVDY